MAFVVTSIKETFDGLKGTTRNVGGNSYVRKFLVELDSRGSSGVYADPYLMTIASCPNPPSGTVARIPGPRESFPTDPMSTVREKSANIVTGSDRLWEVLVKYESRAEEEESLNPLEAAPILRRGNRSASEEMAYDVDGQPILNTANDLFAKNPSRVITHQVFSLQWNWHWEMTPWPGLVEEFLGTVNSDAFTIHTQHGNIAVNAHVARLVSYVMDSHIWFDPEEGTVVPYYTIVATLEFRDEHPVDDEGVSVFPGAEPWDTVTDSTGLREVVPDADDPLQPIQVFRSAQGNTAAGTWVDATVPMPLDVNGAYTKTPNDPNDHPMAYVITKRYRTYDFAIALP